MFSRHEMDGEFKKDAFLSILYMELYCTSRTITDSSLSQSIILKSKCMIDDLY